MSKNLSFQVGSLWAGLLSARFLLDSFALACFEFYPSGLDSFGLDSFVFDSLGLDSIWPDSFGLDCFGFDSIVLDPGNLNCSMMIVIFQAFCPKHLILQTPGTVSAVWLKYCFSNGNENQSK